MKSFIGFIKSVKRQIIGRIIEIVYNFKMFKYVILYYYGKIDLHILNMWIIYLTTDYCFKCIKHDVMSLKEANDFLNEVYEKLKEISN